ncbi:adenylate/guanylate cyclase domain-containing protein [Leptospira langatensis]|uniref:Adenylate/guanylate cyclase domain-containing protein n=1 Tax=Leptospira langatensis TaxID=2484983 RepID=A0A5F1ZVH5_9LEPT|nr:adenylate/guanylate cyclase domain-containing protein [Leptospira langatensis]TGK03250.1 adenylate/guanylate cyclase domain-containing protein [Leptospira langatensis]TGL42424.1 adenylate/guanylate cyclase domain-containing protein [Leptospira langatensis]
MPPIPWLFNTIFKIPQRSGLHQVDVKSEFHLNKDDQLLKVPAGLYFPDIGENWKIELNGIVIREEWYPIKEDSLSVNRSLKGLVVPINNGILKPGKNEIKIQFLGEADSNPFKPNDHFGFYHTKNFRLSSLEGIYNSTSEYFDIFLFGIYFIFGFYHVLFFVTRKQDIYYLYFGLFSLLSSVYFYLTTYHLYNTYINYPGGPDTEFFFRGEISALIPIVPIFMLFAKDFFYQKDGKFWMIRIFCGLSFVSLLANWLLPFEYVLPNLLVYQVLLLLMLLYVILFSINSIRQRKPDSVKLAIGIGICGIFGLWDTLDAMTKIVGFHYPFFKISFSVFILVIISLLVSRYVSLYKQSQALNQEISKQRDAFYRFVPSEFISILDRESPVEIKIGDSKEKTMSVFFADLRGYTTVSEKLSPDENIKYLNRYFSAFEDIIFKNAGFVDKYIGDAIMALFSDHSERAEKDNFNSADNALQSAIDMVRHVHSLNDGIGIGADLGIGVNTGPLILGTVGSERRIDTTVVGDTVNLSSRVQSLSGFYKTKILVTHHTFLRLNLLSEIRAREIDTVIVKGKTQPVILYEIFEADPPEMADQKDQTKSKLSEGITLYKAGQFKSAFSIFKELYKQNPSDNIVRLYAKRTKLVLNQLPSGDWDGIFRLHRK